MRFHVDTDFLVYALSQPGPERRRLTRLAESDAEIQISAVAWYEFSRGPRTPEQLAVARALFGPDGVVALSEELADLAADVFRRLKAPRRRAADVVIGVGMGDRCRPGRVRQRGAADAQRQRLRGSAGPRAGTTSRLTRAVSASPQTRAWPPRVDLRDQPSRTRAGRGQAASSRRPADASCATCAPHLSSAARFSSMNECSAYVFAVKADSPGTA